MGEPEIVISELLLIKLDFKINTLHNLGYFGHLESSKKYVNEMFDFINTIPSQTLKFRTKNTLQGSYYCKMKVKNKRTVYYFTYDIKENLYLIRNCFSSHEYEYHKYIK